MHLHLVGFLGKDMLLELEREQKKKKEKKMKEKGKQQQGDWKSRRTYTQKECMWCGAVPCLCLTFDLFYEVFFLSEVLLLSSENNPYVVYVS